MANASLKTKIMNFMETHGPATRKEIIKFIYETKGIKYNFKTYGGFFSSAFMTGKYRHDFNSEYAWCHGKTNQQTYSPIGYLMKPSKTEKRYLIQEKPYGKYCLAK